jgi:hypothetical protein
MPWELTGNPDADIRPDNFLGTRGRDRLRIKTFADGDRNLSDRPNGKDVVFITTSAPGRLDRLGSVGIRTNRPESALHVNGAIICGGDEKERSLLGGLLVNGGVWQGRDLNVPYPGVPLVAPVPGELALGGIRTSIRGFDGGQDDPGRPDTSPIRLGSHWIRTNGNESELWMAFARFRTVSPVRGQLYRVLYATVPWVGPSFNATSDARLKTNVRQLEGALDKLERIRGVAFEWAEAESPSALADVPGKPSIGVVAQEVEEVFPEVVSIYAPDPDSEEEYKAVDYDGLTSVLIEAVKELKAEIEALRSRIEALERA